MLQPSIPLKKKSILKTFIICAVIFTTYTGAISQNTDNLKLDPELLVLLKQCNSIISTMGDAIYPGWDFQNTPILFYKPNVQELLINFPHKPDGFSNYTGFNPLIGSGKTIYTRNGTTYIPYDDQNTTLEIDGVKVLVVADTYSSMRNQLKGIFMNQPIESVNKWLDNWGFVSSPYHKLTTILHEGFHVYQEQMAPEKNANENKVAYYPFLDPVNNSLSVLEGNILKDALLTKNTEKIYKKINEFVAVRTYRHSLLDSVFVAYENLNEFKEGTGKYVEFKFYSKGADTKQIDEMKYVNGFTDFKNELPKLFKKEIEDMVNIVSVNDNRFGNKFGAGPLRYKLYFLGASQGLLLDKIMPEWKNKIFEKDVYLSELLKEASNLSNEDITKHLKDAKEAYNYNQIFKNKQAFEKEGNEVIQSKINAIMKTKNILVIIDYKGHKLTGMNYTPFGVTKVGDDSIIYEMVPVGIYFDKVPELISKTPFPIMVNKKEQKVYFSVKTPLDMFESGKTTKLSVAEFKFVADEFNIVKYSNCVVITFK
jgi:hypothetical protein